MTEKIHGRRQTCDIVDTSWPTLKVLIEAGRFPAPFQIGNRDKWTDGMIEEGIERLKNAESEDRNGDAPEGIEQLKT